VFTPYWSPTPLIAGNLAGFFFAFYLHSEIYLSEKVMIDV